MLKPEILIKSGGKFLVTKTPVFDFQLKKWVIKLKQIQ